MSAINPLTNDELYAHAPSIFAEEPAEGVSNRYAFVPTHTVLDTFREAGYYSILASESKVRNQENLGYQKHIIQFRSLDNLLRPSANEEYADIVLTNSHNRTSSFKVDLAFWRLVCSNMLIVPSHTFVSNSIIHSGFQEAKISDAIQEVTSYMPAMEQEISMFKQIELSDIEQRSLANAAISIRFDTKKHLVEPDELLTIHRQEDADSSLWTTFNRIQEAIIRGGIKGKNMESGRNFTSKAINAIDTNFSLNKELWSTVKTMARLKSIEPMALAA